MSIQHHYHRVPGSRGTHAAPIGGSGTDVTSLTPMTIPMQHLSSHGAPFTSPMCYANYAVRSHYHPLVANIGMDVDMFSAAPARSQSRSRSAPAMRSFRVWVGTAVDDDGRL